MDTAKIETDNVELKRLLHLSIEDLRFADYIVKNVCEDRQELVGDMMWEGGDEWIRMQFKIYLFSLLRTSLLSGDYQQHRNLFHLVRYVTNVETCLQKAPENWIISIRYL